MILWEGRSKLNGEPAVAIMTGNSKNPKTGPMWQVWILPRDVKPRAATSHSVCGTGKHRCPLADSGACYVNGMGPAAVWKAYRNYSYDTVSKHRLADVGRGKAIRLGAWGDPAAVPMWVWEGLLSESMRWTAYTHQWRNPAIDRARLSQIAMASCDRLSQVEEAQALGWRAFAIVPRGSLVASDPKIAKENGVFPCPATPERGYRSVCFTCGLCNGMASRGFPSVAVAFHGAKKELVNSG